MTDEEKWEIWRNKNAEIISPYGGRVHKHIVWHEGADRRKAFLDGFAEGRKEYSEQPCTSCCITNSLEESLDEINYDYVNLAGQNKLLLAQIEKMKNCKNCSYGMNGGCDYYNAVPDKVQNCEHWRLAE